MCLNDSAPLCPCVRADAAHPRPQPGGALKRTLATLVVGLALGYAAAQIPATSYTYREAFSTSEAATLINLAHWEVVPGQPDSLYLRQANNR